MYDIAIVGAGPAGSTAARLLADKYRVLLVDRRRLIGDREDTSARKLCGGLLAPAAQKELARQGLGVPGHVTTGPQLFAVRTLDRVSGLERLYQRHYVNVDREEFDRWLVGIVPDSVDVRDGWSVSAVERDADGMTLRCRTRTGAPASARARLLVGADGAGSLVRMHMGRLRAPRYVAVQGTFSAAEGASCYGAVFDPELTDFYGWTVPKREGLAVGISVPAGGGAVERYERFVAGLRTEGWRFGVELDRGAAPIVRPRRPGDLVVSGERTVLLGEAAGLISPSSAEGISYALRSGAVLGDVLAQGVEGAPARYRDAVLPLAAEVVGKMLKSRALYSAGVRGAVMRSAVGTISEHGAGDFSSTLGELLAP